MSWGDLGASWDDLRASWDAVGVVLELPGGYGGQCKPSVSGPPPLPKLLAKANSDKLLVYQ